MPDFKVIVVGGGAAGATAACLLAKEGLSTALISQQAGDDPRTVALMQPTLQALEYLGIWPGKLANISAPVKRQRIVDDTGSLFSGAPLNFDAREIGLEAFAWNVPLAALTTSLLAECRTAGVTMIDAKVVSSITVPDQISVNTDSGDTYTAELIIAADGHGSILRQFAGITTSAWQYDQSALVTSFSHSSDHQFTSCEYSKRHGPCTVVPLPGKRSAVVWMDLPQANTARLEMQSDALCAELQLATHSELGLVSDLGARKTFPMRGLIASSFGKGRTLLVGEAAHVVPPIGAQGLNMSMRDAALACDLILNEIDAGAPRMVETYVRQRHAEVAPRSHMIHAMNKSLLLGMTPVDGARAAALWAVQGLGPLRQEVLRFGLGWTPNLPFAMRWQPATRP